MKNTLSMLACSALLLPALPGAAAEDISPSEKALFVTNHLATLTPPMTLRYSFRKGGSLEPGFDDKVSISLRAQPDGRCCTAAAEFLSGSRRLALPEVESAQGNPVILYFLERDIREMQRLTKGQPNYFRKRIRMAVYQGATMTEASVSYRGRSVAARQITVAPYVDDPLRTRFETLAGKRYVFTLSDQVPGGVVSIRSQVDGTGAPPLLVEEMTLEGVAR
ncbi:MAG TPA: hypothetical protein VLJ62_21010 [Burkholderiaceae bacterium]|nr:hypothetical protein [Burkholderiaceae bacterium]